MKFDIEMFSFLRKNQLLFTMEIDIYVAKPARNSHFKLKVSLNVFCVLYFNLMLKFFLV